MALQRTCELTVTWSNSSHTCAHRYTHSHKHTDTHTHTHHTHTQRVMLKYDGRTQGRKDRHTETDNITRVRRTGRRVGCQYTRGYTKRDKQDRQRDRQTDRQNKGTVDES